ncbi:MAG: DUF4349 domain-containing protein [Saprospiraceae bacterium]|nr:DUF4349 domain-containing protein [Saprospiraceae bacterium]
MQIIQLFFFLSVFVLACGQSPAPGMRDSMMQTELAPSPSMDKRVADESTALSRKKIRNGQLRLRVNDVRRAAEDVRQKVLTVGGEIQDEQENSYNRTQEIYLTVRVPANLLDSIMADLCQEAGKVENRSVSESDITEVYYDTDARLVQKRALEKRYLEILQQAKNVEDLLAIERELNQVRSDIESMDGQMRSFDKQVAMSTLVVSLVTTRSGMDNFFSELGAAFGQGWTLLLQFLLFLASGWAVILFLGASFWLLRKWRRNRR